MPRIPIEVNVQSIEGLNKYLKQIDRTISEN